MPRKLKTFVTSVGFFEQAIAAPSMKAALEAWGAGKNAFKQGFAEETDDPEIIAATMAKPGVVLKRAVGSKGTFTENAELPKFLPVGKRAEQPKPKPKTAKAAKAKTGKSADVVSLADARAAKLAAAQYEKEQARRDKEEEKKEATRQKERARRDAAKERAQAALDAAKARHEEAIEAIASEREKLDRREDSENARWDAEKKKLEAAVRKAGD
jgi:colicin import membrane protein